MTFRTIDGSGNNGDQGELNIPLIRLTDPAFEDGFNSPRGGEFPVSSLPNPRTISNVVVDQPGSVPNFLNASNWLWQWGQLLDHDFALNEDNPEQDPRGEFTPVPVPPGDPDFPGVPFLPFVRVPADAGTGTDASNPRQVNNQITAFLDGSLVYGSEDERAEFLREFDKGLLKTTEGDNGETLLPLNPTGEDAFPNAGGGVLTEDDFQFLGGDVRVNEQLGLAAGHTLLVREHNRVAEKLYDRLAEGADTDLLDLFVEEEGVSFDMATDEQIDEFIYEAARAVVGAKFQAISYNEFVPLLIGDSLDAYTGFDSSVSPQVSVEFANAAFRLGHTLLTETIRRTDGDGVESIDLQDAFFVPEDIQTDGIDDLLTGLILQPAEEVDNMLVDGVRNFLFEAGTGGLDLASVNIARGREVGIGSYTEVYEDIFGVAITSFDDLGSSGLGLIADDVVALLEAAYTTVDEIDLWLGGISETAAGHGGLLGPTLSFFLADQFERSATGDEFFYLDDDQADLLEILHPEIGDATLADLIRDNVSVADSYLIPDNAFITPFENEIFGGDSGSTLRGTRSADLIDGQDGNDSLRGGGDDDILLGGLGDDTVRGNGGSDRVLGGSGDDSLRGDGGNDTVVGGAGNDTLKGGGGSDLIDGGTGNDIAIGNGGSDTFVFASDLIDGVSDTDAINQFRSNDSLDFSDYLGAGGTIDFTRVGNKLLEVDLSGEDTVLISGSRSGIDAAEAQLSAL